MVKNKEVYFIRHGKLLLNYKNHADMPMHILADLASKKIDPPIDSLFLKKNINKLSKIIPFGKLDVIYASPSKRCRESAEFISDYINKKDNKKIPIITSLELKEVKFDLHKIYKGKNKVVFKNLNDDVFKAMVTGVGSESAKTAQMRINKFMNKIKKNKSKRILVISHDFVMRVIEIYAKNNGAKGGISLVNLKDTQRNDYLNGFGINVNFKKVVPVNF